MWRSPLYLSIRVPHLTYIIHTTPHNTFTLHPSLAASLTDSYNPSMWPAEVEQKYEMGHTVVLPAVMRAQMPKGRRVGISIQNTRTRYLMPYLWTQIPAFYFFSFEGCSFLDILYFTYIIIFKVWELWHFPSSSAVLLVELIWSPIFVIPTILYFEYNDKFSTCLESPQKQ